jgi:competence protein ComEC
MVLGDSRALDNTETARNFKITGLAHLIAVSGSHLAVIAVMLAWALERTSARRWFKTLLLVAFLAVYVVLTGFQPSAIRAAIMASVGALSFAAKRRRHTPSLLCAAALAMLVIDPANTFDVGYWLSVFAVLGISLFYPLARSLLSIKKWFYDNYVAQPAALTIVAQAATLPLSAAFFGMLSLVSPLANLLAAPFATIIVGGGIFALMLNQFYDPLAMLLIQAVCAVADAMIMLVNWLASLPVVATPFFMELPLAIGVAVFAGATIYIFWRRISKKVCTTMLAIVLVFALVGAAWAQNAIAPKLIMLSIGQGDAILVRDGPSTVLVDTGPSDTALLKALARQGVKRLDAVVLTHLDDDHAGALDALYGVVDTDTVYIADGLLDSTRASPMRQEAQKLTGEPDALTLARGDMLNISSALSAQVVWPQAPALEGANEESICLLLRYDCNGDGVPEFQSLLMGDAEQEELAQILASEQIGEVAVFKVGHHGSTDAVRASQLVQLNSKIALISAGENNRFGHPTAATLNELAQAQVEVFRTDQSGDITVSFTPTAIDVSYTGQ